METAMTIIREGDDVTLGHIGNPVAFHDFDTDEEADAYAQGVQDALRCFGLRAEEQEFVQTP